MGGVFDGGDEALRAILLWAICIVYLKIEKKKVIFLRTYENKVFIHRRANYTPVLITRGYILAPSRFPLLFSSFVYHTREHRCFQSNKDSFAGFTGSQIYFSSQTNWLYQI